MSYIQLPYKTIKLTNFLRNHNMPVLFLELQYFNNINNTEFQCSLINTIQNKDDLQRYLLNFTELGQTIQ